jgi:ABC-type branched-subunit amino acid transport system substrate-binding protein
MTLREPMLRSVFHLRASYQDEIALIVRKLTNLGLKKIAVFHENDSYGKAGLDGSLQALRDLGLEPVAIATVERNTVDVAQAVNTIVPLRPDAVIQISAYKSCAAFILEARKAGYGGTFYNISLVGTQALSDELGSLGAGVVVSQVVPSPYNPANPLTRDFWADIKQTNNTVPINYSSMEGYVAARLFTEGMEHRQRGVALTREVLIRGLEGLGRYSMNGFDLHLSANKHVASNFVELSMLTGNGRVRT